MSFFDPLKLPPGPPGYPWPDPTNERIKELEADLAQVKQENTRLREALERARDELEMVGDATTTDVAWPHWKRAVEMLRAALEENR